jgi:hypothetical protein
MSFARCWSIRFRLVSFKEDRKDLDGLRWKQTLMVLGIMLVIYHNFCFVKKMVYQRGVVVVEMMSFKFGVYFY